MIIGDPAEFALESCITKAYQELGFRALGYFAIHVGGHCYGVRDSNATMLACSFDEVGRRITTAGRHTAAWAVDLDAFVIARAYRQAVYGVGEGDLRSEIGVAAYDRLQDNPNNVVWAPDGDAAFDDGSYVLQMDAEDRVRIVAFQTNYEDGMLDPASLVDFWMQSDRFYCLLRKWYQDFLADWSASPKTSEEWVD